MELCYIIDLEIKTAGLCGIFCGSQTEQEALHIDDLSQDCKARLLNLILKPDFNGLKICKTAD